MGQFYCQPSSRAHCFAMSAQLVASWADNRFVHVSFSRNPQKDCNKHIVSDIQSHENNVCVYFVKMDANVLFALVYNFTKYKRYYHVPVEEMVALFLLLGDDCTAILISCNFLPASS